MRIFTCCFSANSGSQEVSQHKVTSPPSGLGTVLSAPFEADNIVSTTVHSKAPYLNIRELCTEKEWKDLNCNNAKDASGGLECALSLQAKLCAAGRTNQFREARAGYLVDIVQKHLGASAARLYIMASGYSNDGAGRVVECPLVHLACALSRGTAAGARSCNAQLGQDCSSHSEYLCPKHEPVGSSSVLLRQAMVSKVSVVLKCPARQEPPINVDSNTPPSLGGQSRVFANPAGGVSVGVKSTHMGPAAPAVAGAQSNSSGYSSSAVHAELDTAAAAAAKCDAQCCPDLDLMETDALPGSAMVFAAMPLVYGMATLGVLWLAVPIPDEDTPNGGSPTYQLQTGTSTLTGSDLGCSSPPFPPLPPTLLQQQQEACNSSRYGIGATPRVVAKGSSLSLAASNAPAALLSNPAALEHVALSVAMHLAGGCADVAYLCRLGQALHGLAESATLAELVLELCNSLTQHVRQQFYVDVTAHAALVPAAESRVAFMLRSERVEGTASVRAARQQLTQSRLRMSSVASVPSGTNLLNLSAVAEANRSRSVTLTAHQMANNSRRVNPAATAIAAANASAHSKPQQEHQLQRAYTTTTASGDNVNTGAPRACSLSALRPSVPRDVFMLESSVMRSDGSFGLLSSCQAGAGGTAGVGFPPPALSARAFRLSNTLLQAMLHAAQVQQQDKHRSGGDVVSGVVSGQGSRFLIGVDRRKLVPNSFDDSRCAAASAVGTTSNDGVLAGVCVRDCARHVQDERQPSRDVCMLMMSAGDGTRFAAGTPAGLSSSVRGGGAMLNSEPAAVVSAAGGNGGGGAQSLVLLGIETGDGAVLAVYLAFPTPAPIQLLDAVREGCNALLREHLATMVRHRLRCADLAAEWETLRAGVPGSYLSVSRGSIVPPDVSSTGTAMSCIQSPLSQPSALRAAPLLMMSAGSNTMAVATTDDGGFLQGALSSCRGIASLQGRGVLGSVPGTAPVVVAGSEASLVSLAPGMGHGGGQMGAPQSASNISANGHASLTSGVMGGAMGSGPMGRSRKPSLTHGGMEDAGLTLGGPAWLQRSRRSASAVPMVLAPARSASSRGLFMRMGSLKHAAGSGGGGATGGLLLQPPAGPTRSPLNSGCFAGRFECTNSPVGPLTVEADDEEHGGWVESMAPGTGSAGGGLAAAGMLTVHDLDETYESWGMRAHMGALVDCILSTTLRSSGAHLRMDDGGAGRGEMAAARVTEGLDELQLSAVLGQGASGVVLKGMLGCTPVAVKIMEMPDADASIRDGVNMSLHPSGDRGGQAYLHSSDDDTAICAGVGGGECSQPDLGTGGSRAAAEPRDVRARRALLRNAMEVAIMRSISHVNIVQAFGVYDNVIMERHEGRQGIISLRRINQKDANDQKVPDAMNPGTMRSSPICTAIVLELCDRGSLADVLHNRSFPALPLPPPHPSASPAATAGAAMQFARYWKGVFMTLLEIALALRHLHSRRLVHRDMKPGNILLKSSPGDPRGWTCKLADFGFALVLDQLDQPSLEENNPLAAPAGGGGVGGAGGHCSSSSSSHPLVSPLQTQANSNPPSAGTGTGTAAGAVGPRDWYTIQQHIGGTVTHMAPEAFKKGSRIDASVDVFSFGIIMWELVCSRGHRPHKDLALDAINNAVVSGARPIFPPGDHVPLSYRQLARSCWSVDPRLRPTAAELVTIIKGLLESTRA
ncbi:hypothetical protein VaNZ11_002436 [Volvox africanus]|uniref:Protein kinase domain-containing protein n=1 Tax=Volvox africanus TaxID=51714 RepID=A0ABQ5RRZ7_9CHLO|nr:hypothetical protein VaNZ11_002436 [Volvox africanus]